jgi:hypothetical protein
MIVGALETLPDGPGPGCGVGPPHLRRRPLNTRVLSRRLRVAGEALRGQGIALATIIRCLWRLARAETAQHEDTEHPVQSASEKPLEA